MSPRLVCSFPGDFNAGLIYLVSVSDKTTIRVKKELASRLLDYGQKVPEDFEGKL